MDWLDASFLERDGLVTYVEHIQNGALLVESPDAHEPSLANEGNGPWPLLTPPDLSTLGGPMLPSSSLFTGTDDDDDFMGDLAGAFALAESESESESEPAWRGDGASTPTAWEGPSLSSSFLPSGLSLATPRTLSLVPEPGPAHEPHTDTLHTDEAARPEESPWAPEPEGLGGGTPTTIRAAATFVPLTFAAVVEPQPSRSFPATALDEQHESIAMQSSPVTPMAAPVSLVTSGDQLFSPVGTRQALTTDDAPPTVRSRSVLKRRRTKARAVAEADAPLDGRATPEFEPMFTHLVETTPSTTLPFAVADLPPLDDPAVDRRPDTTAPNATAPNATACGEGVAGHGEEPNTATVPARTRLGTLFAKVDPSPFTPAENPRRAKAIRLLAGTSLALGLLLGGYTFLQTKSKTPSPATVVSETTPKTAIGGKTGAADSGDLEFGNGGDFSFSEGGDFTVK